MNTGVDALHVWHQAWRAFVDEGEIGPAWIAGVPPSVLQSWQRCSLRLNPRALPRPTILRGTAFISVLQNQLDLLAIARPLLEDICQWSEGSNSVLLLTDAAACILDVVGKEETLAWFDQLHIRPGTYWNENQMGTNAVALTLKEALPIQIRGALHYLSTYHTLVTTAAPIHEVTGRIIGALAVASPTEIEYPLARSLMMSATRAIEYQLQADMHYREANRRLAELNSLLSSTSGGVLSWNQEEILTHMNAKAGQILGLKVQTVKGRSLQETLQFPPNVQAAIAMQGTLQDIEAAIRVNGDIVNCLVSLHPISEGEGEPMGYIMNLEPIQQVRRLINRMVGAQAHLTLDDVLIRTNNGSEIWEQVRTAAQGRSAPILLQGEPGVGKTTIARAIHNAGTRANGPFIAINCTTIPHELMVSEFLGYEGGAFSGALSQGRPSKFELADGGTLFLDEVEGLTLKMQAALLQVNELGYVMRLGATHPIPVDLRIVASSSVNLLEQVNAGHFRRDLYYHLSAYTINVPPLRRRPEDIQMLTERFLQRYTRQTGCHAEFSDEAMAMLVRYPWPGNVRELESVLERALVVCHGEAIVPEHLPEALQRPQVIVAPDAPPQPVFSFAEAEREAIVRAGHACEGKVTEMAACLGISRSTLWRKMKQFRIDAQDFKGS